MTMRAYAFLYRFRMWSFMASVVIASFPMRPFWMTVVAVLFGLIAMSSATYFMTGAFKLDIPEDEIFVGADEIRATQGSRAPVCFSKLVEVGWVRTGSDPWDDDTLYFLRASDGAWCAFPTHVAGSALTTRLAALTSCSRLQSTRSDDWQSWGTE